MGVVMIERKHWHPDLTDKVIFDAAKRQMRDLDDPGFCVMCGNEQGGCEPDARRIRCEACGARQVFGAAELFMHVDLVEADDDTGELWPTGGGDSD
jgi:hypothetical protein